MAVGLALYVVVEGLIIRLHGCAVPVVVEEDAIGMVPIVPSIHLALDGTDRRAAVVSDDIAYDAYTSSLGLLNLRRQSRAV